MTKPAHEHGYTAKQLENIKRKAGVTDDEFSEAFGISTCMWDEKHGTIFYKRDIEKALYLLKKGGKFHFWD